MKPWLLLAAVAGFVLTAKSEEASGVAAQRVRSAADDEKCVRLGPCSPCAASEVGFMAASPSCKATGYKQEHSCHERDESGEIVDRIVYLSCAPQYDGANLLWFESAMLIGSACSLYVVYQRKLQARERLTNILNN